MDIETWMVQPLLRPLLFRTDPCALLQRYRAEFDLTEKYLEDLTNAVVLAGMLTPVLLDEEDNLIAGRDLVEVAVALGVDDIPALRQKDLLAGGQSDYLLTVARYFENVHLDPLVFLVEMQEVVAPMDVGRFGALPRIGPIGATRRLAPGRAL